MREMCMVDKIFHKNLPVSYSSNDISSSLNNKEGKVMRSRPTGCVLLTNKKILSIKNFPK